MKNLRVGELRFIARQIDKLWRVYDRARGSYPYHMPELGGEIVQDTDKESAEAEAERLNKKFVKQPKLERKSLKEVIEGAPNKKARPVAHPPVEESIEEEVDIPELPDYGEPMTEEEAKRYEDGLMEEVKY